MVRIPLHRVIASFNIAGVAGIFTLGLLLAAPARAAIPAGYKGMPFDPKVVGGAMVIPPGVKAGPYAIPGAIDFVNYDMGGDGVGYHTDAHYTTKDGDGYRTDRPTATMSLTSPSKPDLIYGTGTAQDGMAYPTGDFYIGSVHPGDWFNYTVDVKTAGTYALSSSFSTGNGPPGGEGGDGQMELQISVDGTMMADWHTVFPDFQNKANFHNWKPYPSFAMITLDVGPHVIKFQAPFKHLNLDHVTFDLVGGDGGTTPNPTPDAGGGGTAGAGGGTAGAGGGTAGASGGAAGAAGSGAVGAAGVGGGTAGVGSAGSAGSSGGTAASGGSPGTAGASASGAAGSGSVGAAGAGSRPTGAKSGGCSLAASPRGGSFAAGVLTLAASLASARRRRRS
jgi:hypothetical protein